MRNYQPRLRRAVPTLSQDSAYASPFATESSEVSRPSVAADRSSSFFQPSHAPASRFAPGSPFPAPFPTPSPALASPDPAQLLPSAPRFSGRNPPRNPSPDPLSAASGLSQPARELLRHDPSADAQWLWVRSLQRWRLLAVAFWLFVATWASLLLLQYTTVGWFPPYAYFASFLSPSAYLPTALLYLCNYAALFVRTRVQASATYSSSFSSFLLPLCFYLFVAVPVHALLAYTSLSSLLSLQTIVSATHAGPAAAAQPPPAAALLSDVVSAAGVKFTLFSMFLGASAICKTLFLNQQLHVSFPLIPQSRWARFRARLRTCFASALYTLSIFFSFFHLAYFYFGDLFAHAALAFLSLFSESSLLLVDDIDHSLLYHARLFHASFLLLLFWQFVFHLFEIIFTDPLAFSCHAPPPLSFTPRVSSDIYGPLDLTEFPAEYLPLVKNTHEGLRGSPHLVNALRCPFSSLIRHHAAFDLLRIASFDQPRRQALLFGGSRVDTWVTILYGFHQQVVSTSKHLHLAAEEAQDLRKRLQNLPPKSQRLKLWVKQKLLQIFGSFQPIPLDANDPQQNESKKKQKKDAIEFPWKFGKGFFTYLHDRSREQQHLGDWLALSWQIEALTRFLITSQTEDSFGIIQNTNSLVLILNTFVSLRIALETYLACVPAPIITNDPRLYTHQYLRLKPHALIDTLNRCLSLIMQHFHQYLHQMQSSLHPQWMQAMTKTFDPHPFLSSFN